MSIITPDLVEWLVADPQVSSSWCSLARHLSLSTYIPSLEVSRRNRRTDSQRMKELLIIWRSVRPATYTVQTLLNMLDIMGMKDMYEWIQLMTKDKLSPTSVQTYVITRLNCSQHSSLTEVRSDRIGRSITPRPQSCYYSSSVSPHAWHTRTTPLHCVSINSSPANSRPLSAFSDDLDSSLNFSRSSISPDTRSSAALSPCMMKTSTPILHNTPQHRRKPTTTPLGRDNHTPVKDRGVFNTLYRPDSVKRNTAMLGQTTAKISYQHSSYNPAVNISDTVTGDLDTIDESPKTELKQFDEAFTKYKEGSLDKLSAFGTDKYFDNLVALIEEAARGLEL
eukprot:GFUD01025243.1.p1 GENE.GFUD01025243.1~~GFUD01025243.1.p1  ORF type:complete len:337 (+),score=110.73 GFUD01025243.1:60-1070(+)